MVNRINSLQTNTNLIVNPLVHEKIVNYPHPVGNQHGIVCR